LFLHTATNLKPDFEENLKLADKTKSFSNAPFLILFTDNMQTLKKPPLQAAFTLMFQG